MHLRIFLDEYRGLIIRIAVWGVADMRIAVWGCFHTLKILGNPEEEYWEFFRAPSMIRSLALGFQALDLGLGFRV